MINQQTAPKRAFLCTQNNNYILNYYDNVSRELTAENKTKKREESQ